MSINHKYLGALVMFFAAIPQAEAQRHSFHEDVEAIITLSPASGSGGSVFTFPIDADITGIVNVTQFQSVEFEEFSLTALHSRYNLPGFNGAVNIQNLDISINWSFVKDLNPAENGVFEMPAFDEPSSNGTLSATWNNFSFTNDALISMSHVELEFGKSYNPNPQIDSQTFASAPKFTVFLEDELDRSDTGDIVIFDNQINLPLEPSFTLSDLDVFFPGQRRDGPWGSDVVLEWDFELTSLTPSNLGGDISGNGKIDLDDLNLVLFNWGAPHGLDDLNGVLFNWGAMIPPTSVSVPEPSTAILMLAGIVGLASSRRPSPNRNPSR